MQVLLRQDVDKLGKSGELVRVRPGFARNFLLPRQFAVAATTAAVHRIEHERAVALARAEKAKTDAHRLALVLSGLKLQLARKAGEDGRLFGSVTAKDIEAAVRAAGQEVDRKKIHLEEPLKATGSFEVPVKLVADVVATLHVEVVAK
ncbi:MAG: 50S ribosomal protein L9 [Polyangiaceae bacterium]